MKLQVVWFKRDLRLEDHAALSAAASKGPVLPLLAVEPEYWHGDDTSRRQYEWWLLNAGDLCLRVIGGGGRPFVHTGDIISALSDIKDAYGEFDLWSHQETGNWWTFQRDVAVRKWCITNEVKFAEPIQSGVWRGSRLDRDNWSKMWNDFMSSPVLATPDVEWFQHGNERLFPSANDLDLHSDELENMIEPGYIAANSVLDSFLCERGVNYRTDISSPVSAATGSSRLSPYLAVGVLSIRQCYQRTVARQLELAGHDDPISSSFRKSLHSFVGRLHWHCHFIQKLETDPELEWRPAVRAYETLRPRSDPHLLKAFAEGRTGYPFVDACIRQLRATGWINFRMRAMLVSFACYDLFLRWQDVGNVLARLFVDYEPGIHWPQVQMQSGESGINALRIYNPVKQGRDQDPSGAYIAKWIPELSHLSAPSIHEPDDSDRGALYPPPIVQHADAVRQSKRKILGIRMQPETREQANAVFLKLGSRKRPRRQRAKVKAR